ncbi:hypothetical protein [Cellulomonas xylanilytica]|uniref:Uncharacterized protein n=1 Tax=Cellulomonas xylanilytica TaxID=233583 RepID=A0A510V015_9CELL|nr:hypothetical protein [Cellulomonas xylanilytica]GEK20189.1 hypothetical protein CXY01_07090 [Cellulomonas xylanilytica]
MPTPRRARLRPLAVAFVLVVGAGAAVATSPGTPACPDPPEAGVVGEFYGPQDRDSSMTRLASPSAFRAGRFGVWRTQVSAPGCLTADDVTVPVRVSLELDERDPGPLPEAALRTFTVTDGQGRTWSPREVSTRERQPPSSEGGQPYRSYAHLVFDLPLDVSTPVTLGLGDLGDAGTDTVSLDEDAAAPTG